ncbi:MAG: hypothetical protein LBT86_03855 [Deltaproteobacteria bacterium]|jgi:hypothetical protein|nr:hypothetical protein [Deltaproteobacteria bacterium]
MAKAQDSDEPMTLEAKELLDRDLSAYHRIARYLDRARLKIKDKLETVTVDKRTQP